MIKISRWILIAAVGVVCLTLAMWARTDEIDLKVDSFVQASMRQQRIPGLALAVMRDGRIIKAQGYGLSNIELNVPVSPQTVFSVRVRGQAVYGHGYHDAGRGRQARDR